MSLDSRSREYREYVEAYLKDFYAQFHDAPQKDLYKAMEYSLLGGGKRLRPIFAFEFCRLCGRDWKDAAPFAAAVEMIHTYSLIHDDLPCMDNDDYRRGRLTNHKIFGEGMAVLAGDALLTDAFMVASKARLAKPEDMATAIGRLAECAGSPGMVGGQVLDIMSQERELSEQEVLDIQSRKTGALINAACALGAIAGGGSEEQFEAACQFAAGLGLAFQIRDDILDVTSTEEELGKPIHSDEKNQKQTYVTLRGLEGAAEDVERISEEALELLDTFPQKNEFLRELIGYLVNRRN